jgi:hypothetical protein
VITVVKAAISVMESLAVAVFYRNNIKTTHLDEGNNDKNDNVKDRIEKRKKNEKASEVTVLAVI